MRLAVVAKTRPNLGKELIRAPYLETYCYELQRVAEGLEQRLAANMPPRYLKSIAGSIVFPAWVLGRWPEKQIIVAYYGDDLARDHSAKFRRLIESPFYRQVFPNSWQARRVGRQNEFRTRQGGGRRAVTVGGAATGLGADIIILDDILKAADAGSEVKRQEARDFIDKTLSSRLNSKKNGAIICIQQRLHQDDPTQHLLEKDTYRHISMRAIATKDTEYFLYGNAYWVQRKGEALAPKLEDLETLEQTKKEIGAAVFETQYQQDPSAGAESMVDLTKLHLEDGRPEEHRWLHIVQSWDTAVKDLPGSDYNVGMTFGWNGVRWYIIDVVRERLDYGNTKARVLQLRRKYNADVVLIEDSSNGTNIIRDLRKNGFTEVIAVRAKGEKSARCNRAVECLHNGMLGIFHEMPWFPVLRNEIIAFPNVRFDDQVDAISQFVKWRNARRDPNPEQNLKPFQPNRRHLAQREKLEREYGAII